MYFASGRQFAMDAAIIAPYLDKFVSRLLDLLLVRIFGDALETLPFANICNAGLFAAEVPIRLTTCGARSP